MKNRKRRAAALAAAAILCLTGCLAPSKGGARTGEGMKLLDEGDYQGARSKFTDAISAGEEEVPAYRGLGMSYMSLGMYGEAVDAFQTALSYADEKMPDTVRDIRLYLATAQFRSGDDGGTISTCRDIVEEAPSADASFFLGAAYLNLGDSDQARTYFDEAVSLTPDDYSLYLQIYERYEASNLTAVGDQYLQTALGIPPKGVEDSVNIGRIYFYLEQYDKSKEAILAAVDERYMPALELMGEIYLAQGDYSHAQAMYETIMDEEGPGAGVYNGLALCCIASGDYDQALTYIEEGLALGDESGNQQLRFNEIIAYERKLDFPTAKLKAEAYMSLYPTDEAGAREYTFLSTRG